MRRGKAAPRKEKGSKERFNVVLQDDCRQGKYLWAGEHADGFSLEHAQALAAPAGQREKYAVVPLEVHRWARSQGKPISAQRAVNAYPGEES